jgi:hypothetical protein
MYNIYLKYIIIIGIIYALLNLIPSNKLNNKDLILILSISFCVLYIYNKI